MRSAIATILITAALLCALGHALGYRIVYRPTADQLYGCTIENEAPNGECK